MPPPVRIIFYIQPPLSLVVIFSSPLPLIFQSLHPPPSNYCTVPQLLRVCLHRFARSRLCVIISYLLVPRVPFFHLIPVVYSQENGCFPSQGRVSSGRFTLLRAIVFVSVLLYCCFTAAAAAGLPDCLIKVLGRWSSDCYQLYIHSSSTKRSHVCRTSYGARYLILVNTCLFRSGGYLLRTYQ